MKETITNNTIVEETKLKEFKDAELKVIHFDVNNVVVTSTCTCVGE